MIALLTLSLAWGHALEETSGRVELRGDHLSLSLNADLGAWLQRLSDDPRPVGVLAMTDPEGLEALLDEAREELERAHVRVGEQEVSLRVTHLPPADEARAALTRGLHEAMTGEHGHAPRVSLGLEGRLPPTGGVVQVQLPASLGPVVLSFSEPQSATLPPGGSAEFVLNRPAPEAPSGAPWAWGLTALVGLAGAAFGRFG